jgi:uncharacterized membrane protein YdfJ with MMPL/SSD domain
MAVAYMAAMTLLPALIALVKPPPEPNPMGYAALAGVDQFLARHRMAVVAGTSAVALAGLPLLLGMRFDFNPLHLRNPDEEPVAAYLDLSKEPLLGAVSGEVLAPSPEVADVVAQRLAALPQVALTRRSTALCPTTRKRSSRRSPRSRAP